MKPPVVAKQTAKRLSIRPRVKFWFELDGGRAFCPGLYQILRAVEKTGSIKDAALSIERSYRFVWGKIKNAEQALGSPLVETRVGGSQVQRSVLTSMGQLLVKEFETLRQRLFDLVDHEFAPRLLGEIQRLRDATQS